MDVLVELRFKVHRGFETEGAVESRLVGIVKDFDPLEDGRVRLGARGKSKTMNQFPFQSAPEAFHHGVVIAVAAAAHAGDDARLGQALPLGGLNALVGMMHQSSRWSAQRSGPARPSIVASRA